MDIFYNHVEDILSAHEARAVAEARLFISMRDLPRKNLPRFGAVRGADNALRLHPFDDPGRPVVADLHVPLHERDRRLSQIGHELDRLVVFLVKIPVRFSPSIAPGPNSAIDSS